MNILYIFRLGNLKSPLTSKLVATPVTFPVMIIWWSLDAASSNGRPSYWHNICHGIFSTSHFYLSGIFSLVLHSHLVVDIAESNLNVHVRNEDSCYILRTWTFPASPYSIFVVWNLVTTPQNLISSFKPIHATFSASLKRVCEVFILD